MNSNKKKSQERTKRTETEEFKLQLELERGRLGFDFLGSISEAQIRQTKKVPNGINCLISFYTSRLINVL